MTKGIVLAPIVGLFALSLLSMPGWTRPSPQSQDSVAEAARKAREQKKAPAKPAKVVTNDDLSSAASAQVSVVGQAESKGAPGTPGDKAKKPAGGEGDEKPAESQESQWRKRFGEAYHGLHQAEAELDVLQREWSKIQTQYYADPQKALKEQNSRSDVNDHQQKIDAKKKEIEQLHQSIADLEDQLRKAGGDSSWARE
jgi:predicted RNase H-like nuclease (RuvC/YqgF family)